MGVNDNPGVHNHSSYTLIDLLAREQTSQHRPPAGCHRADMPFQFKESETNTSGRALMETSLSPPDPYPAF